MNENNLISTEKQTNLDTFWYEYRDFCGNKKLISESRKYSTVHLAHNHFSEQKQQTSTSELCCVNLLH